jgi:hypothetical protein
MIALIRSTARDRSFAVNLGYFFQQMAGLGPSAAQILGPIYGSINMHFKIFQPKR